MPTEGNPSSMVFDKLVSELSGQERQDLLSRIRFSQAVEETPLREPEPTPETRFERVYAELTFFERILLFFRGVLTGKDKVTLVEDFALKRIARSIASRASEFFNPRAMLLLDAFAAEVAALRDAVEVFRSPLREALGAHKKDFVAFLAGLELPVVQEHLLRESDPDSHDRMVTELSEFDMKRTLDSSLQDAIDDISESDRQRMYRDIQLLHWLQGLATFGFDRILSRFEGAEGGRVCSAGTLIAPLKDLASVLQRLTVPPTTQLVASLFLFAARDHLSEKDYSLEADVDAGIGRAADALATLRRFNATVPLNDIIRVVANDPDWMPALKGGGEDWFVLFKQFWLERLDGRVAQFARERKRRQLLDAAVKMLRLGELPYMTSYRSRMEGIRATARYEHSIAFVRGFLDQVFSKLLNRTVKVFLLDGKFYKEDNRKEFTDAYNAVERLPDRIRALDVEMSKEGRRGKMLAEIENDAGLPASRERAFASLFSGADRDAEILVVEAQKSLISLQSVLDGVLHGHGDDTYDTISNLSQIGGRDNRRLLMSLRVGLGQLAAANEILGGLLDLEHGGKE